MAVSFVLVLVFGFLVIGAIFAVPVIKAFSNDEIHPNSKKPVLDVIGVITNILLSIIYIPLSLVGSLMGMLSEGYMYNTTLLQTVICDVITILCLFTPLVCLGGIVSSALLRIRGRSIPSFWVQFSGIFYIASILLLGLFLDFL